MPVLERLRQFRSEITPSNYGVLAIAILAAAIGFLVAQAIFNRTLITWLNSTGPPSDAVSIKSHQNAALGWLLLSAICLVADVAGSLWLAYQAFRFVWRRRPKQ